MKKKFTLYWYSARWAKTGEVYYITTSEKRAVELFYKDYTKDYEVLSII